jgi:hypothetical protein
MAGLVRLLPFSQPSHIFGKHCPIPVAIRNILDQHHTLTKKFYLDGRDVLGIRSKLGDVSDYSGLALKQIMQGY